jgi:hypothetical protein
MKPAELPWLDQLMRDRSPYRWSYPSAWADLKPSQLDQVKELSTVSAFPLGMASFHFSGYIREGALRLSGDVVKGTELPFLLFATQTAFSTTAMCSSVILEVGERNRTHQCNRRV